MNTETSEENHDARSCFVRDLVQQTGGLDVPSAMYTRKIPKIIVQFWDNLERLPPDVRQCIETWDKAKDQGIERLLFDKERADDFIYQKFGLRHKQAFDKCYHPAMQSDFFRLCYISAEGGCYIDTDDVFTGSQIQSHFSDGRLKIQPLCYDTATQTMVPPSIFTKPGTNASSWIFYFNNNPLIAESGHAVIEHALEQAMISLEKNAINSLPEIQSTTGPGNLTKSIFNVVTDNDENKHTLVVLSNWQDTAESKWELSYRNDARNWRLSNRQEYGEL